MYVGPGAAIRGDWGGIVIEDGCNVQENCTMHMFPGVTVCSRRARTSATAPIVHGARIGAQRADRHERGRSWTTRSSAPGCIVGALCFVPAEMQIPARKVVVGNPAKIVKDVSDEMLAWKTEGTRAVSGAARRGCASRCAPCEPLREVPAGPRSAQQMSYQHLEETTTHRERRICRTTRSASGSTGSGQGTPLVHAVTGEQIAEASSEGLDFAAMLEYARTVGGPALRRLTFHERARMLKALAQYLMERKDEFYRVSAATGATKADSLDRHRRRHRHALRLREQAAAASFPTRPSTSTARPEPLSKGGTFVGRHICVPLEGVAVHINAFNFPVWGMLEKLAPTFLAGVPAIVKPATVTSLPHRGGGRAR